MIIDGLQPQPAPTPTPSPKPAVALKIVSISPYSGGQGLLNFAAPFDSLLVSKAYMDTCSPVAGGYYCKNDDLKWFMTDTEFAGKFENDKPCTQK